jgi:hypothetical protein
VNEDYAEALMSLFNSVGLAPDKSFLDAIAQLTDAFYGEGEMPGYVELSDEERKAARAVFEGHITGRTICEHCGGLHTRACPRIKGERTVFSHNVTTGQSQVIESHIQYWPPGKWERYGITFPEDVYD